MSCIYSYLFVSVGRLKSVVAVQDHRPTDQKVEVRECLLCKFWGLASNFSSRTFSPRIDLGVFFGPLRHGVLPCPCIVHSQRTAIIIMWLLKGRAALEHHSTACGMFTWTLTLYIGLFYRGWLLFIVIIDTFYFLVLNGLLWPFEYFMKLNLNWAGMNPYTLSSCCTLQPSSVTREVFFFFLFCTISRHFISSATLD